MTFDFKVKTPCYIIDTDILAENFRNIKKKADGAGLSLLMAMKGFPLPKAFPFIKPFVDGISASGLFEAKLGSDMGKEVHIHTPAYKAEDAEEIASICSHIVLNSPQQASIFSQAGSRKNQFALRLNPQVNAVKEAVYNPCGSYSRFGLTKNALAEVKLDIMNRISGFHIHALCGNSSQDFNNLISAVIEKFADYLPSVSWINLGGGQAFTEDDFDFADFQENLDILHTKYHLKTYIEPCEYLVMESGFLAVTVLDIVHNEKDIAILDTSLSCHALDVLKNYYQLPVVFPEECSGRTEQKTYSYLLAGNSCLAGDVFGEYTFSAPLKPGDRIIFGDMGSYSFAQQNYFNGINFPDIAFYSRMSGIKPVKSYTYAEYENIYD
ncbi:MAG: carboxynorspermidine decarboxylase [Spirochaetia bacterium]|nr:carboxynorspermidine decarboxylase [Spirochaetia bacterium]